jgi:hypothetical protein
MRPEWCALACVREPAQCSLRHRGQRVNTRSWDMTCVSYWMGVRPSDYTTQDTGPRGFIAGGGNSTAGGNTPTEGVGPFTHALT